MGYVIPETGYVLHTNFRQLGLAAVPFLPYIFDKPVEHAVEWTFHKGFELLGGKESVQGSKPAIGVPASSRKEKEKEL